MILPKTLLSFLFLLSFTFLAFAQNAYLRNVDIANQSNGSWSDWSSSSRTFKISYSGQPGVYTVSVSGCGDDMIKFIDKDNDGNYYYVPVSVLMGGLWCDKSYNTIVFTKNPDKMMDIPKGIVYVWFDDESRIAYKAD